MTAIVQSEQKSGTIRFSGGTSEIQLRDLEPLNHSDVITTPHVDYVTEDELNLQFAEIYDQINAYAAGRPIHMINQSVWAESQARGQ